MDIIIFYLYVTPCLHFSVKWIVREAYIQNRFLEK